MVRLIPGKTNVKVELFKGLRVADLFVGMIFLGLITLAVASNFSGKYYIAGALLLVAIALLMRLDAEPNYVYVLHILRHVGYHRHYIKAYSDDELKRRKSESVEEVAFDAALADDSSRHREALPAGEKVSKGSRKKE